MSSNALMRAAIAMAMSLSLVMLWLLMHRYEGLSQDARIYAMQALARFNPALRSDLYLQNTSQDQYTVFSPLYARVMQSMGVQGAARLLMVLFTTGFYAAAWALSRSLFRRDETWLAVGMLILTVGTYGSYRVFHFSEDYLTARLLAEALVVAALALHFYGLGRMGLLVGLAAMLVHPLMALPGLLLLAFLTVRPKRATILAIAGVLGAASIAGAATSLAAVRGVFPLMNADWLHVVQQRSQFLFLQLWSLRDWEINSRPFTSLVLSALVFTDTRLRNLCWAAMLVGACGLAVAAVAGMLGPVALLVQGQAWRWVWITGFVGALFVLPTALRIWQDEKVGPLCAMLLVASWTIAEFDAPVLSIAALALFLMRGRLATSVAAYARVGALLLGTTIFLWAAMHVSSELDPSPSPGEGAPFLQRSGVLAALRPLLTILLLMAVRNTNQARALWVPIAACISFLIACVWLLPLSFDKVDAAGSPGQIAEFADWRSAIPPTATVYVADSHDSASFAWFTLGRPSYLSLDQSAGVVFSSATALEVRRRSQVLLPLMDEDWKLLSKNQTMRRTGVKPSPRATTLTANMLTELCGDPRLDFLVARPNVGFDPIRHAQDGPWKDWNLYDCRHVRVLAPAA